MIIIEDRLAISHLPSTPRPLHVRRLGGLLVRSDISRREAVLLAEAKLVDAALSRRGNFKYLILKGSVVAMNRVLSQIAKTGRSISAEDNYTVQRRLVHLPNGRSSTYFEPHYGRTNAYRRGR